MRNVMVKVENVTKRFENVVAVDKVSFEVYKGELFSLLGPSGCGKTTTLRIIAGLEKPDEGRVYIDGVDVTGRPAREREVCLVFQEYAVFPHMSVYDNIAFGLTNRKIPKAEIYEKVKEVADLLDLTNYLSFKGGKLGLSEQQRVAIARCLVVKPKVLLLDEPLTLADAKIKEKMRRELKKLLKDLELTVIFVTHDQLEALMISDRVAIMRKGKIVQIGSPGEVYDNPINLFVATFVGSPTINLLEGVLEVSDRELVFKTDTRTHVLATNIDVSRLKDLSGLEVIVGFRPEDAEIATDGTVKGTIDIVEISEDRKVIHVDVDNMKIRVFGDLFASYQEGGPVNIKINPFKLFVFDKKTGNRIL
ncbi:MAG: ABC transporter ATP-binding protein [Desulfurococcaceae archaeon]